MLQLLLDAGADPNNGNGKGITPLCHAAYEGLTDIVALLLKGGADINALRYEEKTALY